MSEQLDLFKKTNPRTTVFSPCRTWRYTLWRVWNPEGKVLQCIGLNPSTADEVQDDPTVRRVIGYARAWGMGALCMTNIFAYRATDPAVMKAASDPVGPDNDFWLKEIAGEADLVLAAWGAHGGFRGRGRTVRGMISGLQCLAMTKGGHPGHPLYLKKTLTPVSWE